MTGDRSSSWMIRVDRRNRADAPVPARSGTKDGAYVGVFTVGKSDGERTAQGTQAEIPLMGCSSSCSPKPGQTILDPCMGSGQTGISALRAGRKFIGMEKDPKTLLCHRGASDLERTRATAAHSRADVQVESKAHCCDDRGWRSTSRRAAVTSASMSVRGGAGRQEVRGASSGEIELTPCAPFASSPGRGNRDGYPKGRDDGEFAVRCPYLGRRAGTPGVFERMEQVRADRSRPWRLAPLADRRRMGDRDLSPSPQANVALFCVGRCPPRIDWRAGYRCRRERVA